MDGLRLKLESQGLNGVVYMVVNNQGADSQRLHGMLAQRLTAPITLYKQQEQQPDVWQTLGGEKDDFFIYDRCGRLTHHLSLPYTIIGQGHVENAIKDTYCKRMCGECTHESTDIPEECKEKTDAQPDVLTEAPPVAEDTGHGHHHGHHHGHGHGHGHGHEHGQQGVNHGHDHNHGHHHGSHDGHGSDHGQSQSQQGVSHQGHQQDVSQGQDHLDLGQMQQVAVVYHMPQEVQEAPADTP